MLGELTTRQIVSFAEQGASIREIADTLQIEEAAVKLVLNANETVTADTDQDVNEAELKLLRRHAFELATNSEDESLQGKMTRWLIERARPARRHNVEYENAQQNVIVNINKAILGANGKFNELVNKFTRDQSLQQPSPNPGPSVYSNIQSELNGSADEDSSLF